MSLLGYSLNLYSLDMDFQLDDDPDFGIIIKGNKSNRYIYKYANSDAPNNSNKDENESFSNFKNEVQRFKITMATIYNMDYYTQHPLFNRNLYPPKYYQEAIQTLNYNNF